MTSMEQIKSEIEPYIRSIRDFPKKGINFRDIMPLFAQPQLVGKLCEAIAADVRKHGKHVDAVAGLEARGFLFGPQIAMLLNVPFVPIRKKGKLPGECIQASYIKEYGEDVVEIQKDAVKDGQNVILIDDLLATGGTLKAAVDLMKKAKCSVSDAYVVIELSSLHGREKVSGTAVTAVITYDQE